MHRRTWSAIVLGGTLGAILGLAVVALAAGRVIGSGIEAIVFDEVAGATRATFLVGQAGIYTLIVAAGAIGGVIIAAAGYGLGTLEGPETDRFALGPLALHVVGVKWCLSRADTGSFLQRGLLICS